MKELLKELLRKEETSLSDFFRRLDLKALEEALQRLFHTEGLLVFTGVGKSGFVAKKIAVTMTSTGTRAIFLSPTDALHGDLGIIGEKDLLIALSKSGESDEILALIPFLRNRGVKILAIVSNPKSRLAQACDSVLSLPMEGELCPFNMAPTLSTQAQLLIGDILSIALMRLKGFSLDDFAKVHPAGRLGKCITIKVKDLMLKGEAMPLCPPEALLVDKLVELSKKKCGCLLIVDQASNLLGIFTDGDLRRSLEQKGPAALTMRVGDLMMSLPRTIDGEALASDALRLMEADQKHPIMVLPVLDGNKVIGLIKMHDIVQSGIT